MLHYVRSAIGQSENEARRNLTGFGTAQARASPDDPGGRRMGNRSLPLFENRATLSPDQPSGESRRFRHSGGLPFPPQINALWQPFPLRASHLLSDLEIFLPFISFKGIEISHFRSRRRPLSLLSRSLFLLLRHIALWDPLSYRLSIGPS